MRIPTRRLVAPFMLALAVALSGLPAAPSPVRAADPITALGIDSEPGDYVGGGQQLMYTPGIAIFEFYAYAPGYVSLRVMRPEGDFWTLSFAAAGSGALAVGTYENAQRSADETHPGLDVGGQGRGCNATTGRFVVSEIAHDAAGAVNALALSFEQHCEGAPAALFGEVRYQATTGYKLMQVVPGSVDLGSATIGSVTPQQTIQLQSIGTLGVALPALSVGGTNAADFAIVSEACPAVLPPGSTCDVIVNARPSASGPRSAQLVVDDDTFRGERRVELTATGVTPVSKVAWGTTRSGPSYSYNLGQSLARTVSSSATYLHATYTTDRVSGAWVDDNGPYAGINYVRTSNRGSTFTTPKRLNSIEAARFSRVARRERQVRLRDLGLHHPLDRVPAHGASCPLPASQFEPRGEDVLEYDEAADVAERPGGFPDGRRGGRQRVCRLHRQRDRFGQDQDQP